MRKVMFVALLVVLVAMVGYGQDYAPPRFGLYEATSTQFEIDDSGVAGVWRGKPVFFRVGLPSEAPGEVWVLWDYDDDGRVDDEAIEAYDFTIGAEEILWRDDDVTYIMYNTVDSGLTWVFLNFREQDLQIAVKMDMITMW